MTDQREHSAHIDFESLNDYVDGRLDARATTLLDKHLSVCDACTDELRSLQALVAATAALPKSVLPGDDIWADLKAAIDGQKAAVLPLASPAQTPVTLPEISRAPTRNHWRNRVRLVAAGVLLVVTSSAITALVLRQRGPEQSASKDSSITPAAGPQIGAPRVLPASFRAAEGQYTKTIEELRLAVDAQRAYLNPGTIRTVDHSLAVVDSAIAEARAALIADPNNRMLVELLSAGYQRKLDLLRRTSELSSRI